MGGTNVRPNKNGKQLFRYATMSNNPTEPAACHPQNATASGSQTASIPYFKSIRIQNLKRQHEKLKNILVQLVYQRKKTQMSLKEFATSKRQAHEDLKQAALENRDELAYKLMEKLDQLEVDENFHKDQ